MIKRPDVDIDFANRDSLLAALPATPARMTGVEGEPQKHKTGVYFHPVAVDPYTGWCAVDFRAAEEQGYFKVDLLNVGLYQQIEDKAHLDQLIAKEPIWELLEQEEFSSMLFHVGNHGDILRAMRPRSVEQLAAVLALIRPAKRHLVGQPWNRVMSEVWVKPEHDEYYFKKSHAVAYALAIVAQMNLICEQISYDYR